MKLRKARMLFVMLGLCCVGGSFAQNLPPLSAGIGEEDRSSHPEYSTKLIFIVRTGAYLADLSVIVTHKSGAVALKTQAEGPWLYIQLPPGDYVVRATRKNGDKGEAAFQVKSGGMQTDVIVAVQGEE